MTVTPEGRDTTTMVMGAPQFMGTGKQPGHGQKAEQDCSADQGGSAGRLHDGKTDPWTVAENDEFPKDQVPESCSERPGGLPGSPRASTNSAWGRKGQSSPSRGPEGGRSLWLPPCSTTSSPALGS